MGQEKTEILSKEELAALQMQLVILTKNWLIQDDGFKHVHEFQIVSGTDWLKNYYNHEDGKAFYFMVKYPAEIITIEKFIELVGENKKL